MPLRSLAIVSTILFLLAQADAVLSSDHLLERGKEEFRAARYDAAADDLRAAASALVGPDERQLYIDTGRMPSLPQFEEALVYLALSNAKLGRELEVRDAVERLLSAERITPTYKTLNLDRDAADFEPLVRQLMPEVSLPANDRLAQLGVAPPPAPQPESAETAERTVLARAIQEQPIEHALPPVTPVTPSTHQEPERAPAPVPQPVSLTTKIKQAQKAALNGDVDTAVFLFSQVAASSNANRSQIAAAATGLYQTAAYIEAVEAFKRMGPFAHGEADLRYYDAVALYETGHYDEARRQLTCALPFLEASDDVARYQMKIEQASLQ